MSPCLVCLDHGGLILASDLIPCAVSAPVTVPHLSLLQELEALIPPYSLEARSWLLGSGSVSVD